MSQSNPKVDGYIRKNKQWAEELEALRAIILDCQLTEEVKWRTPCYTFENSNIVLIGGAKDHCVLSFLKGALLKDAKGILVKPGENTQAARVIRFANVREITALEPVLKAYIREAIEVEKAGLQVAFKKTSDFTMPSELQEAMEDDPDLKAAFEALTPGRQRGYILHFSGAKQSKTRASRVAKCKAKILKGQGFHDR